MHRQHTHTHVLHTNQTDTVKLDIALGLIMNTRTAKYLTPRLLVYAANTHKTPPHTWTSKTHIRNSIWIRNDTLHSSSHPETDFDIGTRPNYASVYVCVCSITFSNRRVRWGCHWNPTPSFPLLFWLNSKFNVERSQSIQSFHRKCLWHSLSPACEVKFPVWFKIRTVSIMVYSKTASASPVAPNWTRKGLDLFLQCVMLGCVNTEEHIISH